MHIPYHTTSPPPPNVSNVRIKQTPLKQQNTTQHIVSDSNDHTNQLGGCGHSSSIVVVAVVVVAIIVAIVVVVVRYSEVASTPTSGLIPARCAKISVL